MHKLRHFFASANFTTSCVLQIALPNHCVSRAYFDKMASNGKAKKSKEITFKIIAVGNADVGKSSLVKRYVTGQYDSHIENTIAVDCLNKEVTIQEQPIRVRRVGGHGGRSSGSACKWGKGKC